MGIIAGHGMNARIDPADARPEAIGWSQAGAEPEPATTYTLRRTGRKALRFDGWQLVEAFGPHETRHVWHDLNLYRTRANAIVVELIVHRRGHPDLSRVTSFKTLDEAAAWLETYAPGSDAPVPPELGAPENLPLAMLQALQLRQIMARVEQDYRELLSDVLAVLDQAEDADGAVKREAAG
jgi:hypothetical protein